MSGQPGEDTIRELGNPQESRVTYTARDFKVKTWKILANSQLSQIPKAEVPGRAVVSVDGSLGFSTKAGRK